MPTVDSTTSARASQVRPIVMPPTRPGMSARGKTVLIKFCGLPDARRRSQVTSRTIAPSRPPPFKGEVGEQSEPGGDLPLFHGGIEHLGHVFPIDQMVHEGLEIVRPPVAVIDVVGVLPNIASQNWLTAVHQRVLTVGRLGDGDLAILDCKP